jgi:hypothetical protein
MLFAVLTPGGQSRNFLIHPLIVTSDLLLFLSIPPLPLLSWHWWNAHTHDQSQFRVLALHGMDAVFLHEECSNTSPK